MYFVPYSIPSVQKTAWHMLGVQLVVERVNISFYIIKYSFPCSLFLTRFGNNFTLLINFSVNKVMMLMIDT